MKSFIAIIALGLDAARIAFSKSKIEKTAAAVVVGVVGSLSLFAEPVQTGPFPNQVQNVCAPVVSSVTVTDDGSAGLRVSVRLSSVGWDMFTLVWEQGVPEFYGLILVTYDAVLHNPLQRGTFSEVFPYAPNQLKTWDQVEDQPVHFDYFVRGGSGGTRGSGGKYFNMKIKPEWFGLRHVRGEHYHTLDHYVNITLYVTNFGGPNGNTRLPIGQYVMHCWVSDNDGNGYYVPVHFGNQTFRQGLD